LTQLPIPREYVTNTDEYKIPIGTTMTLEIKRDIFSPEPYLAYCGQFTLKSGIDVQFEFPVEMVIKDTKNFKVKL